MLRPSGGNLYGEDPLKSAIPIAAAFAALAAGCTTVDDVRDPPVLWRATYPVEFDPLTSCLVRRLSQDFDVAPQVESRERSAIIAVSTKTTALSDVVERFDFVVKQTSSATTQVSFRRVAAVFKNANLISKVRAIADSCGRGA